MHKIAAQVDCAPKNCPFASHSVLLRPYGRTMQLRNIDYAVTIDLLARIQANWMWCRWVDDVHDRMIRCQQLPSSRDTQLVNETLFSFELKTKNTMVEPTSTSRFFLMDSLLNLISLRYFLVKNLRCDFFPVLTKWNEKKVTNVINKILRLCLWLDRIPVD